jgi:translation initiation factor 2 subunit 3
MQELDTLNVIIAGHIDHGKTTLLSKLSGKWTDTHSEELKRGITIKLGYADITISKDKEYNIKNAGEKQRYITFIDAPGHEMLMATMLSGAAIVDAAILVVAANEGIKPQTREHLMALQAKNIQNVIIVQNKIDLVSKENKSKKARTERDLEKAVKGDLDMLETIKKRNKDNIEGYLEFHVKAEKERQQREELARKLLEEDKKFVEERRRKEEELKMQMKLKAT